MKRKHFLLLAICIFAAQGQVSFAGKLSPEERTKLEERLGTIKRLQDSLQWRPEKTAEFISSIKEAISFCGQDEAYSSQQADLEIKLSEIQKRVTSDQRGRIQVQQEQIINQKQFSPLVQTGTQKEPVPFGSNVQLQEQRDGTKSDDGSSIGAPGPEQEQEQEQIINQKQFSPLVQTGDQINLPKKSIDEINGAAELIQAAYMLKAMTLSQNAVNINVLGSHICAQKIISVLKGNNGPFANDFIGMITQNMDGNYNVIFPGSMTGSITRPTGDYFTNAQNIVPTKNGQATGIYDLLLQEWALQVKDTLNANQNAEVAIAGHSLGGEIAAQLVLSMPYVIKNRIHLITFATPNSVSPNNAKQIEEILGRYNIVNIRSIGDIISELASMPWYGTPGINISIPTEKIMEIYTTVVGKNMSYSLQHGDAQAFEKTAGYQLGRFGKILKALFKLYSPFYAAKQLAYILFAPGMANTFHMTEQDPIFGRQVFASQFITDAALNEIIQNQYNPNGEPKIQKITWKQNAAIKAKQIGNVLLYPYNCTSKLAKTIAGIDPKNVKDGANYVAAQIKKCIKNIPNYTDERFGINKKTFTDALRNAKSYFPGFCKRKYKKIPEQQKLVQNKTLQNKTLQNDSSNEKVRNRNGFISKMEETD